MEVDNNNNNNGVCHVNKKRKQRTAKFSLAEKEILLSNVYEFKDILFGPLSSKVSNSQKQSSWRNVATAVSASHLCTAPRSIDECRIKFTNMKSEGLKELSQHRAYMMKTGMFGNTFHSFKRSAFRG